jgi:hypothetical protein
MIGRAEITKRAQIDRVDAQTVERDYILAPVATEIAVAETLDALAAAVTQCRERIGAPVLELDISLLPLESTTSVP